MNPLPSLAAAAALLLLPASASADRVIPVADVSRGAMVTVAGTVQRVLDYDEFRLADASGSIEIYVGPSGHGLSVGEAVTVRGRVDDDGPREIYAREVVKADGSVVRFRHAYD